MYDAKHSDNYYSHFLEWVPYDRFTNIKQIGVGGFSKVYSATWLDGKSSYYKLNSGSWKKSIPKPMKVTLKRLNGSQNMSPEYLNELKVCWNLYIKLKESLLPFYGITKDPETKEFMIIEKYAGQGNLRNILSNNFNKILWKDKIELLCYLALNLKNLHELEYYHKNIHSGNILFYDHYYKKSYILDFGLTGPVKEQKDNVIYGVLPYIAPEVLNGEPYTSSSDIYSFEADKGIPDISTSHKKDPDAVYTSRTFKFSNLPKPVNLSVIASYLNDEENYQNCHVS
ncbi:kinase-like domain-containing protein [Rhizophagus irregularis DAOM 181602=DAOM 197198]|nr:kinase-like domain-containing protein [Rhizophagus irregularis DAOM 181602=DAOM 197198]